jgi:hypothetical protein
MQIVEAEERGILYQLIQRLELLLICRKFISDHDLWQHEGTTGHCVFSKF